MALAVLFSPCLSAAQPGSYWQPAGALIQGGNYAGALKETERLLGEHPDDTVILRLKGICLIELGRADEAVATLRRAVSLNPASVAARFYLAQALAAQGGALEARDLLREVQAMAPASEYARRAATILPDLENLGSSRQAMPDKKRWDVSLRLAGEYDDNVPTRAQNDPTRSKAGSFRLVTAMDLDFRVFDQKLDQTSCTLGAGYSIYQSFHERSALQAYDLTSQSGRLYVEHSGQTSGMPYKARVTGLYTDDRLSGSPFGTTAGLRAALELQWASWAVLAPSYSVDWKNFKNNGTPPALFSRDGVEQSVGFNQYFYTLHNKLVLNIGYAYRWADTKGQEFNLSSHQVNAGATVALPWKCTWTTSLAYSSEDYVDYTFTPRRVDDVITVSTVLSRPLWSPDATLDLGYAHTSSFSVSTVSYRRNVISLGLGYHF